MFGKKKEHNPEMPQVSVETVPPEFYGGLNPTISFKTVEKVISPTVPKKPENIPASLPKAPATTLSSTKSIFLSRKKFFILGSVTFVVITVLTSVYYWRQAVGERGPVLNVQKAPVITVETDAVTSSPDQEVPAVVVEAPTTTPVPDLTVRDAAIQFPSILLSDSADEDKDGLTDVEEELFKTDPEVPDSDNDVYADAHEVYNLYNPAGREPMKIIESSLVREYVNPVFGYTLYYPMTWALGEVDPESRTVLFSTLSGENIEARVIEKKPNTGFSEWFSEWAPGESFAGLEEFTSVFKEAGKRRTDYLVYYFEDTNFVYVLTYHTTDSTTLNYRTVIKMMARSFKLRNNTEEIPTRVTEGVEDAALKNNSSTPL